jgi:hypothetical protein
VRVPSRRTSETLTIGGMLSISKVVLSIDAVSAASGGFDGESDTNTCTVYRPFGTEVVSHTRIGSVSPRFSGFQAVSPSRR